MKERCFVFQLVDHDTKTVKVIEAVVYDNKTMEWLHTENTEEYAKWLTKHILWEKQLKKHVKLMILRSYIGDAVVNQKGGRIGDYRVVKKTTRKEYSKINMNKNPTDPFLERTVKYQEKYITKLERGQKSVEWPESLRYPHTFEHYMFLLESPELDNNIKLTEVCGKVSIKEVEQKAIKTSNQNTEQKKNTEKNEQSISLSTIQTGGRERNSKRLY